MIRALDSTLILNDRSESRSVITVLPGPVPPLRPYGAAAAELEFVRALNGGKDLDPNGSCLGIALLHCWEWIGASAPQQDLEHIFTINEAVGALSIVRRPKLVIRRSASLFERLSIWLNARRLHLDTVDEQQLSGMDVLLCLRSMRQLYGLRRSEGHWIAARLSDCGIVVRDDLWQQIATTFLDAHPIDPAVLLKQVGPTIKV